MPEQIAPVGLAEAEQHARTLAAMPAPIGLPFAVLLAEYDRRGTAEQQLREAARAVLDHLDRWGVIYSGDDIADQFEEAVGGTE